MSDTAAEALAVRLGEPTVAAVRRERVLRTLRSPLTAIAFGGGVALLGLISPGIAVVGVGVVGAFVLSVLLLSRRGLRFISRLRPAYAEAERGSFDRAFEVCTEAMRSEPFPISHLSAITVAYFLRRQGRFDDAIALLGRAANSQDPQLRRFIGIELAVCYALKGTTGAAMTWLPELDRKHDVLAASYALVWARIGETAKIPKLRVRQNRGSIPFVRHEVRLMAILTAYAVFRRHPDYLSIRPLLLEAGPVFRGEFDYLGLSWPEMREFIDTYVAPPRQ